MLKFKKMCTERIPLLLITANVGSIFESPKDMLPIWTTEFLQTVVRTEPKFIALHMQEVGGKTYEKSMQYVREFTDHLCDSPEMKAFDKVRIYLDEDFSSPEKFTALGNIYFVHSSITDVKIWDYFAQSWVPAEGKEIHAGNIEDVSTKEKAKFPQHFFPECKWSRKGFLRVRWLLRGTAFELVNVHLFHDASNLLALDSWPSVYSKSRRRALAHTLQHLNHDPAQPPFFIFGDFNFRLDTGGVVKRLTENLKTNRIHNGKSVEHTKLQYKSPSDERIMLTVGKKEFTHVEHQKVFRESWVLKYDKELDILKPYLYEFPIKFPPSYPFEENLEQPTHYMKTRCPAWCDRILLSQGARMIINHLDGQKLGQRDHCDSRRSIVEQIDGVLKHTAHGSRRSIAESTDSGGGSPTKGSHRSSHSSSESSPARSASPNKFGCSLQPNSSPARKVGHPEFEGLMVPGITQSRKSIADPTNIMHAINSSRVGEGRDGSPTRRRLVRNQSEGSPKLGEHSELKKIMADSNPSLRKRIEYGVIGESACMGDHKPIFLRVLLQTDKGIVRCGMPDDDDLNDNCYAALLSETCLRHASTHSLSKCPSKECFEQLSLPTFRNRLASQISYDSGYRNSKDRHTPLVRLGTDPSLVRLGSDFDYKSMCNHQISNENVHNVMPEVQINVTDAEYISYDDELSNSIDRSMIDPHLLYCSNIPMDPYTPESIDSHSPYPEPSTDSVKDESIELSTDKQESQDLSLDAKLPRISLHEEDACFFRKKSLSVGQADYIANRVHSISPRQLKSRLENILRNSDNNLAAFDRDSESASSLSRDLDSLPLPTLSPDDPAAICKDKKKNRFFDFTCCGCRLCNCKSEVPSEPSDNFLQDIIDENFDPEEKLNSRFIRIKGGGDDIVNIYKESDI